VKEGKRSVTTTTRDTIRNGVDTAAMFGTLDAISGMPELGRFQFRASNEWLGGAHNRSTIQAMSGAGQEDTSSREVPFRIDAGEPPILLGSNEGPNPAEAYLHALAACLTTSLVYVAAARGVTLTRVESVLEGEADLRGALGLSDEVRNGFDRIEITFRIEGDAPPETLRALMDRAKQRSFVFDCATGGVPVAIEVETP
jgi:uncharacterized OsmC-like protein